MNFKQLALNIQQFVPDLSVVVIKQRINQRYQQILRYRDWEFLNDEITFGTEPYVSSGTSATIAYGSKMVRISTTSGVSFSPSKIGWYIRFGSEYQPYEITGCTGGPTSTTAQLGSAYASTASDQTGVSFTLFKSRYVISTSAGNLSAIVYQDRLAEVSLQWIDQTDPDRSSTGTPERYAIVEQNKARGYVTIELWPPTDSDSHNLRARFRKIASDLSADSDEPLCAPELLEAWALYDCYKIATIKNPNYRILLAEQKQELRDILHEEVQRDLNQSSLPTKVRDTMSARFVNDDFALDHDVGIFEDALY